MTVVLVTDGEQRSSLATVRSLGARGDRVHVCSSRPNSLAGSSRYCVSHTMLPDPLKDPERFVAVLLDLAKKTGAEVLLPVTEASLLAVLPHRARFNCAIPFASDTAFSRICDKREVLMTATRHGIAVPLQREIASKGDLMTDIDVARFPIVLKPIRSVAGKAGERVHTGVTYARDREELRAALERLPASAYPVLLQERIEGPGFAISVLVWDDSLRAAFAHRRIREKPPSGGVSVLRESIPLDSALLSKSVELLRSFNWHGVAMVEFKLDEKSGIPYLMEINGRLWGSLQLAIDAGVDFPSLLVQLGSSERPPAVLEYRAGVRSRWEWGEVDHLLARLFRPQRHLVRNSDRLENRGFGSLGGFLRGFGSPARAEVFRRDDPRPFIRETMDWFNGR
jgi:predicted ATP-grasp superfamily ATP-dependent carboligase